MFCDQGWGLEDRQMGGGDAQRSETNMPTLAVAVSLKSIDTWWLCKPRGSETFTNEKQANVGIQWRTFRTTATRSSTGFQEMTVSSALKYIMKCQKVYS